VISRKELEQVEVLVGGAVRRVEQVLVDSAASVDQLAFMGTLASNGTDAVSVPNRVHPNCLVAEKRHRGKMVRLRLVSLPKTKNLTG